ncbi:MAG TPA: HD domain-containing phosphohydrolase [Anaerolineae bacterium]|nr:HD domain-containing phosphohydrolase [Anaerolineae bacterium]
METDKPYARDANADQLKKYADDLVKVYKSEKRKRKELEAANLQLIKYGYDLRRTASDLKAANLELHKAYLETICRLVMAAEYRDEDTGDHIVRIGRYSALIAEKLGMSDLKAQDMLYAAPMHDIGKIGIPDHILLKPGELTDKEFDIVKNHTTIGANILSNSNAKIIMLAEHIALSHHEKWNGSGYPDGLSGRDIPRAGRIVAIADVFDALASKRPYKEAFSVEATLGIMKKERGQHFDPDMLDIFLANINEILKIRANIKKDDFSLLNYLWSKSDYSLPV